jgi:hypothetical protein
MLDTLHAGSGEEEIVIKRRKRKSTLKGARGYTGIFGTIDRRERKR